LLNRVQEEFLQLDQYGEWCVGERGQQYLPTECQHFHDHRQAQLDCVRCF